MGLMLTKAIIVTLMIGYIAFRLSFTVRSIRARRGGDTSRADLLSQSGYKVYRAATGLFAVCVLVVVVVLIAQ